MRVLNSFQFCTWVEKPLVEISTGNFLKDFADVEYADHDGDDEWNDGNQKMQCKWI